MRLFHDKKMPKVPTEQTVIESSQAIDHGKLQDIDNHELLKPDQPDQSVSFDQIKAIGEVFLNVAFNKQPMQISQGHLNRPETQHILSQHFSAGNKAFWTMVRIGANAASVFPATATVIASPNGFYDIELQIVPIHVAAFKEAQSKQGTDSMLALAAAAALAPQLTQTLTQGIETTHCSSKKAFTDKIRPDHGSSLAAAFDGFDKGKNNTFEAIAKVTQNATISVGSAGHLHGQNKLNTRAIVSAAGHSKLAAGVPLFTQRASTLGEQSGQSALYIATIAESNQNGHVQKSIRTVEDYLATQTLGIDLAFLAAVLGFTNQVVGDSRREKKIETLFDSKNADMPLADLLNE